VRVFIADPRVSNELKDVLEITLAENHEDRWTVEELLLHPFIANDKHTFPPEG